MMKYKWLLICLLLWGILTGCAVPQKTQPATQAPTGQLKVHFIDVGQADAALLQCNGENMLIDGGNAEDSNLMYTYLKKQNVTHLDYVIGTHAHEDHIGGLSGALRYASVDTAYCPVTDYDSKAFRNFASSVESHNTALQIPDVGTTFSLGEAQVEILAVNTTDDTNNSSIVLRVDYGQVSFLFTGDAEREVEQVLLDRNANLSATVLKVGHHGSDSSTTYPFLREVMPRYSVISVGKDNSYGHPTETTLSRLRDADTQLFRTDLQGDIIFTTDGKTVQVAVSRNQNADTFDLPQKEIQVETQIETQGETQASAEVVGFYILNTNSKKFHYEYCSSAKRISDKNRQEYNGSRDDLIDQGYDPCKNCNP